ncbi:cdc42 effector protein 2 [Hypomesus transpacificus]|uniref:cdc42 effector protein 2 n=1 Tax=Hypomesus transpacificus TaxID=137520 RepID=UPI001F087E04|nr:cdc42 effector protein 2 [Hypomesus transpacificus]XP_046876173.1 cdc42 effector protein 2 [Hypomesus transpacificus]XP_046876174.1 cdc42 effector protein 2 [Hypomesus transpacificus]XP_046876175.1 cdc42 effector protein 2 [Hypomesus transpacificus]XP_046876176.1 cdc42 effector protein 2 [Hypomesus transpacificus]
MSTKAPIYLKRRSRKGKKEKLRDILSSDMISPPLGDFRHTIHIGSGGGEDDLFGDLSFLQGKFHLLPGQQGHSLSQRSSMYGEPFQFSRTASVSGHTPSSESSPLLKNAFSLPVIGGVQAITLPLNSAPPPAPQSPQSAAPPPKPPRLHLDDRALPSGQGPSSPSTQSPCGMARFSPPLPRVSSVDDVCIQDPYVEDDSQEHSYMSHAGSLLSLHLDLGPSILDDVLQIMDSHRLNGLNSTCLQGGMQGIYT